LIGFATHLEPTYEELSREFLATFKFTHEKRKPGKKGIVVPPSFDVKFRMQEKHIVMTLEFFCEELHIPYNGSLEEIPMSSDEELAVFWASISVKLPRNLCRAKLNHIQHPGLILFAAFLSRGFLARDNSAACTGPILNLLKCSKEGGTPIYNLGVMLARTLSYSVAHNYHDTPLTCGAIATMVHKFIKVDMNLNSYLGKRVEKTIMLDVNVLTNMGILFTYTTGSNYYQYMTADDSYTVTSLPRPNLFNRVEEKWKVPEQIPTRWG
jgi:hypothetical protein